MYVDENILDWISGLWNSGTSSVLGMGCAGVLLMFSTEDEALRTDW